MKLTPARSSKFLLSPWKRERERKKLRALSLSQTIWAVFFTYRLWLVWLFWSNLWDAGRNRKRSHPPEPKWLCLQFWQIRKILLPNEGWAADLLKHRNLWLELKSQPRRLHPCRRESIPGIFCLDSDFEGILRSYRASGQLIWKFCVDILSGFTLWNICVVLCWMASTSTWWGGYFRCPCRRVFCSLWNFTR